MTALVCCATRTELHACRRGISKSDKKGGFQFLLTGVGMSNAANRLEAALSESRKPFKLIVSSGFAISLSPSLKVGDFVIGEKIGLLDHSKPPDQIEILHHFADIEAPWKKAIALSNRELITPKRFKEVSASISHLTQASSVFVDMESFALFETASRYQISFTAARLISDSAESPLPSIIAPATRFMQENQWKKKVIAGIETAQIALRNLGETRSLIKNGIKWSSLLEENWKTLAQQIEPLG